MKKINNYINKFRQRRFYSKFIKKNDLCFDIGANKGGKSKIYLSLGAKVIAFEPQSICKSYLENIKHTNFTYHLHAVGSKNEIRELQLANHIEVATFSNEFVKYFQNDSLQWKHTEKVIVKKLNTLIESFGVPLFCKVDVEGYELEIFSDLDYTIPMIEFEFTGGFIENTLEIIKLLDKTKTIYNFNLNEKPKFELKDWISCSEMINIVKKLPVHRLHGNIFVKNL
ncbi:MULTISPECIES: FkbM family methyltransferase [Aquimarina]|uniref:FkbM family methyltransferase n=1 Tax=Aquimarina algiphila TaxID=2047982 RepID=A0A554VEK5_9FLAO|nr:MULTISPECIES: FkbM family methyltransferase [Aquimarina]TSE05531.1 FkbM family methyltransferase [Aquimarina algiphila]